MQPLFCADFVLLLATNELSRRMTTTIAIAALPPPAQIDSDDHLQCPQENRLVLPLCSA